MAVPTNDSIRIEITAVSGFWLLLCNLCSANNQWSRRIAHFQGFPLHEVSIRIVGRFNHAATILLIEAAVRSCLIVNPILFGECHAATSGDLTC